MDPMAAQLAGTGTFADMKISMHSRVYCDFDHLEAIFGVPEDCPCGVCELSFCQACEIRIKCFDVSFESVSCNVGKDVHWLVMGCKHWISNLLTITATNSLIQELLVR
ncbi:hypothetical protein ABBQ38_004442 [Trebouxia sp. C0009 RCD-2024]